MIPGFLRYSSMLKCFYLASINAIERPFHPDTAKDLGDVWVRQGDQILPTSRRLAKPNALMFFHIPLYVNNLLSDTRY
jgi:hypothetical protein